MPEGSGGTFDRVKEAAEEATKRVRGVFTEHSDKADDAIEKAGDFVDDKTGGKYSEHIDTGAEKAKEGIDKLGES